MRLFSLWTALVERLFYLTHAVYHEITVCTCRVSPSSATTTVDLGRPENLKVVETLGLEPELKRADMVSAAIRKADGVVFYEYDLALSPPTCGSEMATACLPEKVILISCAVRDGMLYVVRADADAGQWKRSGRALRLLRSSFKVDGA